MTSDGNLSGAQGGVTDDADGQRLGFNNTVARDFIHAADTLEELAIRCGRAATMDDIMDWQRTLYRAFKYQNLELAHAAMGWFNSTRGAEGEANQQAMSVAIGQLTDVFRGSMQRKRTSRDRLKAMAARKPESPERVASQA